MAKPYLLPAFTLMAAGAASRVMIGGNLIHMTLTAGVIASVVKCIDLPGDTVVTVAALACIVPDRCFCLMTTRTIPEAGMIEFSHRPIVHVCMTIGAFTGIVSLWSVSGVTGVAGL